MSPNEIIGISIKENIGLGDKLQFSSLPENYFKATGKRLVDVSRPWFFDHNPYVIRDDKIKPDKVLECWNFSPRQYRWKTLADGRRHQVFLSNAEVHAATLFDISPKLVRPRLYRFEEYAFEKRTKILFHPYGRSHGALPDEVIEHVINKYSPTRQLYQVHKAKEPDLGLPKVSGDTLWDLAREISTARLYIGVDSGPLWIAACFPDVQLKKVRTKPGVEDLRSWVPLDLTNIHSHWDDRIFQAYNTSTEDVGFTQSYLKL